MESKRLRQLIDLQLDAMGMQGPVKRNDVAVRVKKTAKKDDWTAADLDKAMIAYIQKGVTVSMNQPHSKEYIEKYLGHVPQAILNTLAAIPRFICVSPNGGAGSEHVLSIMATPEDWMANHELKRGIADSIRDSSNHAREIMDYLIENRAKSLNDLMKKNGKKS